MTTFYLIRHAENDCLQKGIIAGRQPGVHLNAQGRLQSQRLADQLQESGITHIYSSPLERAQETAAPLAARLRLRVQTAEAIAEVNFGDWTGKRFEELRSDPGWRVWNVFRSGSRIPQGETMLEVQGRFVEFLSTVADELGGRTVALFSHGDPIRAALLYYLGMPLDLVHRIEVSPASLSVLSLAEGSARLLCINRTHGFADGLAG